MPVSDSVFAGSVPAVYDDYLVPLIFDHFADDLARRAAADSPARVMELAAGTGVVPRRLAPLLGADADYLVTDLNPAMLEQARRRQPDDPRLRWAVADATALDVEPASMDVILCQFGVMFFPGRVACYEGIRRALRPGGTWLFNAWDRIEVNEVADEVTKAVSAMFPDTPPRFLARTPHGYHDPAQIRADVEAAGFTQVTVETIATTCRAPTARHAALAYCQGTPLRGEIEALDASRLDEATNRATAAVAARWGDGPVDSMICAHVVTARA